MEKQKAKQIWHLICLHFFCLFVLLWECAVVAVVVCFLFLLSTAGVLKPLRCKEFTGVLRCPTSPPLDTTATVQGPGDDDRRRRKNKKILRRRSSGGPETFASKDSISSRRRGSLPIEVLSSSITGRNNSVKETLRHWTWSYEIENFNHVSVSKVFRIEEEKKIRKCEFHRVQATSLKTVWSSKKKIKGEAVERKKDQKGDVKSVWTLDTPVVRKVSRLGLYRIPTVKAPTKNKTKLKTKRLF